MKIHESDYSSGPLNFHIEKYGPDLQVTLTYPAWKDADIEQDQCRYVTVNQEAVRASNGVRLHYDYERDGFVVEQPQPRLVYVGNNSYEEPEDWVEVAFLKSWKFNKHSHGARDWSAEEFEVAETEYEKRKLEQTK